MNTQFAIYTLTLLLLLASFGIVVFLYHSRVTMLMQLIEIKDNAIAKQDEIFKRAMSEWNDSNNKTHFMHEAVKETVSPETYILIDRAFSEKVHAYTQSNS